MSDLEIEVDLPAGASEQWKRLAKLGGQDAVDQISVLAESHMKDEAPEGAGIPEVHMRSTIKPQQKSRDPYRKVVAPTKKTSEGWPLHHAIVEGSSNYSAPPPLPPLLQWAEKKADPDEGETFRDVAEDLRWHIFHYGIPPNPFVYRSIKQWENQVDEIAQEAIDDAYEEGDL